MFWLLALISWLLMFCMGGLTFWFLTDNRVVSRRQYNRLARSRREVPPVRQAARNLRHWEY